MARATKRDPTATAHGFASDLRLAARRAGPLIATVAAMATDRSADLTAAAHERAAHLRELHVPGDPLVLPNAWDAASAARVQAAGFAVVATSSAAVAESLGRSDHGGMDAELAFAATARIGAAVDLPLTADVETGYGLGAEELVGALARAGASGCNLEDTDHERGVRVTLEDQSAWLRTVRAAADASGFALVLNARIDSFLRAGDAAPQDVLEDAVTRAVAYRAAGADCVYPIGRLDDATVAELVRRIPGPINVMWASGDPTEIARLAALGVARVSAGSSLWHRALVRLDDELVALRAALPS